MAFEVTNIELADANNKIYAEFIFELLRTEHLSKYRV